MPIVQLGSKTFRQLQAKWYRKLENEGFVDIERSGERNEAADFNNPNRQRISFESKQEYWLAAKELLNKDAFIDMVERRIWVLHTIGYPIRRIVLVLASEGTKTEKNEVNRVIMELRKLMFK